MTALMQEIVDRVHAMPDFKRDDVTLKLLDVVSNEEEAPAERIVYVEIADDLTDEEIAEIEDARTQMREHPELSISLDDYLAKRGITKEDLDKVPHARFVYNI